MSGVWPAEGRLTGRSAASGRLVDGDGGKNGAAVSWRRRRRSAAPVVGSVR
jgi:hypothetical protein